MRRALASIRCSPADKPRLASRCARSRTTSTTWTRSPDASFSRFALYRCDQSRPSSPPSTVTPQPISKLPGSLSPGPKLVPRMTAIGHTVMPPTGSSGLPWCWHPVCRACCAGPVALGGEAGRGSRRRGEREPRPGCRPGAWRPQAIRGRGTDASPGSSSGDRAPERRSGAVLCGLGRRGRRRVRLPGAAASQSRRHAE